MAPSLHPVPSPFSDTFVRVVTRPAVAEPVFASLDQFLDSQSQEDSEGTVVVVATAGILVAK